MQQREGDSGLAGSPFKRHRASLPNGGTDQVVFAPLGSVEAVPSLPPPTAAGAFGAPAETGMAFVAPEAQQVKQELAGVKTEKVQVKQEAVVDDDEEL